MKWRSVSTDKGVINPMVVESDSHTIVKATESIFIVFRKAKPMAKIVGRFPNAKDAKEFAEADLHEPVQECVDKVYVGRSEGL